MRIISQLTASPELQWVERVPGEPSIGFLAQATFLGCSFHVIATPIGWSNGTLCALDPSNVDEVDALHRLFDSGAPMQTVRVNGHDCIVSLTPHDS